MEHTKLIYMEHMQQMEAGAKVLAIEIDPTTQKTFVVLDQTIFYPQGGGQPYDQGTIENENGKFIVEEVRFVEGIVRHIGSFDHGSFIIDQEVKLTVDAKRRRLHMRLHSGGHVLDMAVNKLGLGWIPGKGYHWPEGPYIEYSGEIEENQNEELRMKIENAANGFIAQAIPTTIKFLPDELVNGKPARVVLYGDFSVPCGGTHVANLKDIGHIVIRKISSKKGLIRAAYDVTL